MMLSGARVLVVDDDHDAASTLTLVLTASGFHAATVPDASSALGVTLDEDVAVVVCAFTRRGVGATTDLVTALRGRPEPRLRDARVIVLVDHEEDTWLGLGAAVDDVLVRPVAAQQLADAVTGLAAAATIDLAPPRRPAGRRGAQAGKFRE